MTRRAHHSDAGFTLVELLASLAVLGLFSLLLLDAMAGRRQAWARLDRESAAVASVETVQGELFDRLSRIWPATNFMLRPTPGPDFDGWPTQILFLAPAPQAQGAGPLRRYRLGVDPAGDLTLESRSDVALDPERWSERRVLLRGVQAVDLAYFGSADPGQASGWRPEWRGRTAMPELVRIRLAFAAGDHRRWPDLIVHPQADIDTECRLVPATGGCAAR